MEFFVSGRQVGKTYYLLQWMEETPNSVMVCPTAIDADKTFKMAQRLGFEVSREQFISFSHRSKIIDRPDAEICVDNIDLILTMIFNRPPKVVTATGNIRFPKFLPSPNDES